MLRFGIVPERRLSDAARVSTKRGLGRGLESLMDRPAAEEPRTVRVTVTNADAPGLRQFLNRRPETAAEDASPNIDNARVEPSLSAMTPVTMGQILMAADAVVVTLSWVLLAGPGNVWVRTLGFGGMVAGAVLGVTGALLLSRKRRTVSDRECPTASPK